MKNKIQGKTLIIFFANNIKYNEDISSSNGGENIMSINIAVPDKRINNNLQKLDEIERLSFNWNEYGAEPLSKNLIKDTRELLKKIYIQPEIFPTATGSIQIEYEKDNGDYLEIQITESSKCDFYLTTNNQEKYDKIEKDANEINKLVNNFYELSF